MRSAWANLSDTQLLAQCEVDTYRASGPGGQKRNKTSSAVRLRHLPSGLLVIAEESRSQHENKAKALQRLRQALHLKLREPLSEDGLGAWRAAMQTDGRLELRRRDPRYWPAAAVALDALAERNASVRDTAALLGITTANLIDFLASHPKIWQEANQLRTRFGLKPLR